MRDFLFQTSRSRRRTRTRAGFNPAVIVTVLAGSLLVGGVVSCKPAAQNQPADNPADSRLSAGTRNVLNRLATPMELRFYSLLDPASVPAPVVEFANRASQLLGDYESAAAGKITLRRFDALSDDNAVAAAADGIQPFNQNRGATCFLGIAIICNGRKETLPLLSPDWEPALEADLSRALARVAQAIPENRALTKPSEESAAARAAVKRAIPNLESVSADEGARMLRRQALAESQAYARETEAKIKEAEQRFLQAQQSGNEAGQQAALKELQQLQGEKLGKLQEIAAQTQARVDALKELKSEVK